jgi:hypothetical protein
MPQEKQLLSFISDKDLEKVITKILNVVATSKENAAKTLYKNQIDPFSAVFDASLQKISLSQWLEQEKSRQMQKTLQNTIGDFHQDILGAMTGWENLGRGHVLDVRNPKKKIIAEIKNKHNTTKGNHRKQIYDDIKKELAKPENEGFTGYYVEIIPKNQKRLDKPFTPSDNLTQKRRMVNESIRVIDGKSFYKLATGVDDALEQLYNALPRAISMIYGTNTNKILEDKLFYDLFQRVYGKSETVDK